jgi:hypothetical protein
MSCVCLESGLKGCGEIYREQREMVLDYWGVEDSTMRELIHYVLISTYGLLSGERMFGGKICSRTTK